MKLTNPVLHKTLRYCLAGNLATEVPRTVARQRRSKMKAMIYEDDERGNDDNELRHREL